MLRANLEFWLQRVWYAHHPPWWLKVPSRLFAFVVRMRSFCFRRGWFATVRVGRPVIVVGNVTVGGTGKTPVTVWLAQQLTARGLVVGVILRGYGSGHDAPRRVLADSDPLAVGDESVLIRQRTGCAVVSGRDRVRAARLLAPEVDVLIADDGLGHLALGRDFEIAVVDAARGCGNGWMLPAGPLREPVTRLTQVDQIIINGRGEFHAADALRVQVQGTTLHTLQGAATMPLAALAGRRVHALAGIGNPQRFFDTLRAAGLKPIEHVFVDHHRYVAAELQFGDGLPVLMTQKDAVKCRAFAAAHCWYLPVEAMFANDGAAALLDRIEALVRAAPRSHGLPARTEA